MTQQAGRVREVVVGVDGSDEARRALAWRFREAGLRGVAVRVLTVWTGSPPSGAAVGARTTAQFERDVEARLRAHPVEAARARRHAAAPPEAMGRDRHPVESVIEAG